MRQAQNCRVLPIGQRDWIRRVGVCLQGHWTHNLYESHIGQKAIESSQTENVPRTCPNNSTLDIWENENFGETWKANGSLMFCSCANQAWIYVITAFFLLNVGKSSTASPSSWSAEASSPGSSRAYTHHYVFTHEIPVERFWRHRFGEDNECLFSVVFLIWRWSLKTIFFVRLYRFLEHFSNYNRNQHSKRVFSDAIF